MRFDADFESTGKSGRSAGADKGQGVESGFNQDPVLQAALRDFRSSVHSWSEAVYNRPRSAVQPVRWKLWQTAGAWSLGCILAVGIAGGGYAEHQHRQQMARVAAAQEAARQRQLAEVRAREAEEELARVDRDIARQVPNAMEPLAQLMSEDETQ